MQLVQKLCSLRFKDNVLREESFIRRFVIIWSNNFPVYSKSFEYEQCYSLKGIGIRKIMSITESL